MATERHLRHFQDELDHLKGRLLEMGGLAEDRVRTAVRGLVERDLTLVERVLVNDAAINQLHIEIDDRCFKLLALHQPMAVDLRAIVSAVKINTDLERVGDLAVNIAEAVGRYMQHPPVKELIDIPRMAVTAQDMLRDALDAYVRRDTALAQQVLDRDEVRALAPCLDFDNARFPVQGGLIQRRGGTVRHDAVAWGYARAASERGVDIVQNCEVTGIRIERGRVVGVETTRGYVQAGKVGLACAGNSSTVAAMAGPPSGMETPPRATWAVDPRGVSVGDQHPGRDAGPLR